MCLWRKKQQEKRKPSIPRRMATSGRTTAKRPLYALQKMVDMSTLISPTHDGGHRPVAGHTNEPSIPSSGTSGCDMTSLGVHKLAHAQRIVLKDSVRNHLQRIYDLQRGRDKELSRDKFQAFLRSVQGETAIAAPLDKDWYPIGQFLEVWYRHYGWDVLRPLRADETDLGRPISNYFISSSHNTYLDGDQFFSESRPDMYRMVLRDNCRCIEIDVWNGETAGVSKNSTRSRSPHREHQRNKSAGSLITSSTTAEKKEALDETLKSARDPFLGKPTQQQQLPPDEAWHMRCPSACRPALATFDSRGSSVTLNIEDMGEPPRFGRPRASSKASKGSRSTYVKNEPRVLHGWTGTKPTGFREVCKAVRDSAFANNPLPIIVSLEVHADMDQQEVMVDIMKEEWDSLLLEQPHEGCDPKKHQPLLKELLNKILIKVKRPPSGLAVPSSLGPAIVSHGSLEDDTSDDERLVASKRIKRVPICSSLAALAIYTHSEHFQGTFEGLAARSPSHIFSISETRILELYASKHREMFAHNRDFFMRAFPSGHRVDSSNMDPAIYWRKGVQMVAMNWQSCDEGMMLNGAMFAGTHGWVLKPPGYRSAGGRPQTPAFPEANQDGSTSTGLITQTLNELETIRYATVRLRVTILAGQNIPLPEAVNDGGVGVGTGGERNFQPFVTVKVHVERANEHQQSQKPSSSRSSGEQQDDGYYKKKTKPRETANPDYGKDGTTLEFPEIAHVVEELSFVRFKIEDNSAFFRDPLAAWACLRLDRIQPGYRFVDLYDPNGKPTEGKLFVRIEKIVR